ncbi:MAG: type 1 glutamine amidotransferase [Candidatus Omnitrophica bacterium]|nr:type 1 glutamine amidotransferase [Candidatus Omnitrophota bacterium]
MILIIQHIAIEAPGLIKTFFEREGMPTTVSHVAQRDVLPEGLKGITAIIILGGPMNVYEEEAYPFLKEEDRFIRKALQAHIPILGICLGAQLLAKACGAVVRRGVAHEMGWHVARLTDAGARDPLFARCLKEFTVFQWHEDRFDIPADGVLLAESEKCAHQAFRVNGNAYGIQFHIEVTPEMVTSWILAYLGPESLTQADIFIMVKDYFDKKTEFQTQAGQILSNFSAMLPKKRV